MSKKNVLGKLKFNLLKGMKENIIFYKFLTELKM